MKPKINLLFPIEIINRELDFRLMFAGACAQPDYRIWIGNQNVLYKMVQANREGLYLGKHIISGRFPTADQSRYVTLKNNGYAYIHLDEEGAVHPGGEEEWSRIFAYTLDPRFLKAEDHVCTWGDWQRDFYQGYDPAPACRENILTTGHPRFDLYKAAYREYFAAEVKELRERYGNYVLMNTNFSFVNRPRGVDNAFSARYFYKPEDAENRLNQVRRWRHISHILANFVQLAMRISAEFPDLNVILRPHPSEDISFYDNIFGKVPNVHVEHEGPVGPWILGSRCLIHDGCTTALEAHFGEVPIINYKSEVEDKYDKFLPNLFGYQAREEDETVSHLRGLLAGNQSVATPENERAISLLENLRSEAFGKLAEVVGQKAADLPAQVFNAPLQRTSFTRAVKNRLGIKKEHPPDGKLPEFYGFEQESLDRKLASVQRIFNKELRYRLLSSELLAVEM